MAHHDISKSRMVEGIKMKSNSEWNKRADMGGGGADKVPVAEELLALDGGWEGAVSFLQGCGN